MARLDLRYKMTSPGHIHSHKHCLQSKALMNSHLLTTGLQSLDGWHLITSEKTCCVTSKTNRNYNMPLSCLYWIQMCVRWYCFLCSDVSQSEQWTNYWKALKDKPLKTGNFRQRARIRVENNNFPTYLYIYNIYVFFGGGGQKLITIISKPWGTYKIINKSMSWPF